MKSLVSVSRPFSRTGGGDSRPFSRSLPYVRVRQTRSRERWSAYRRNCRVANNLNEGKRGPGFSKGSKVPREGESVNSHGGSLDFRAFLIVVPHCTRGPSSSEQYKKDLLRGPTPSGPAQGPDGVLDRRHPDGVVRQTLQFYKSHLKQEGRERSP